MPRLRLSPAIHRCLCRQGSGKALGFAQLLNVCFVLLAMQSRGWLAAGCWFLALLCQLACNASLIWRCLAALRSVRVRGSDRAVSWVVLLFVLAWTGWIVSTALQQKR